MHVKWGFCSKTGQSLQNECNFEGKINERITRTNTDYMENRS